LADEEKLFHNGVDSVDTHRLKNAKTKVENSGSPKDTDDQTQSVNVKRCLWRFIVVTTKKWHVDAPWKNGDSECDSVTNTVKKKMGENSKRRNPPATLSYL